MRQQVYLGYTTQERGCQNLSVYTRLPSTLGRGTGKCAVQVSGTYIHMGQRTLCPSKQHGLGLRASVRV